MSDHAKGLLLTSLGVLVITPDALLIRLIEVDPWTLAFWRGLLSAIGLAAGLALVYRGRFLPMMLGIGAMGLVIGGVFGLGTVTFVWAMTHTSAANTLLIVSTGSMFGALFSWLLMRERLARRTLLAMIGTLAGLLVLVAGDLGSGHWDGDLAALATAALAGLTFSLIRKHAGIDMVPALIFGGLVTAAVALPFSAPATVMGEDIVLLATMGLAMMPLAFALQFVGARYIPAAEVALLILLEAVLAPLLLWLVLAEHPGPTALPGGAIVLASLGLNAAWGLRRGRKLLR
ncbi:MAG: DMT family transporter [Proteobacteria bacterium]|nr:DMT family transporter [Pseudomonadota bacterium]